MHIFNRFSKKRKFKNVMTDHFIPETYMIRHSFMKLNLDFMDSLCHLSTVTVYGLRPSDCCYCLQFTAYRLLLLLTDKCISIFQILFKC